MILKKNTGYRISVNLGLTLVFIFAVLSLLFLSASYSTGMTSYSKGEDVMKLQCRVKGKTGLIPDGFTEKLCQRAASVFGAQLVDSSGFEQALSEGGDVLLARLDVNIVSKTGIDYTFTRGVVQDWVQGKIKRGNVISIDVMDAELSDIVIDQLISDLKRLD